MCGPVANQERVSAERVMTGESAGRTAMPGAGWGNPGLPLIDPSKVLPGWPGELEPPAVEDAPEDDQQVAEVLAFHRRVMSPASVMSPARAVNDATPNGSVVSVDARAHAQHRGRNTDGSSSVLRNPRPFTACGIRSGSHQPHPATPTIGPPGPPRVPSGKAISY